MNAVILVGRMTRDAEVKTLDSGSKVVLFTIAVDRSGKSKETDFIDCKAWGTTGDFISKYFTKGKPIAVKGELQTRSWETSEGSKRKATEVRVDQVAFVPGSSNNSAPAEESEELVF